MSTVECGHFNIGGPDPTPLESTPSVNLSRIYHRIKEVRVQQGVSVRSAARKLGLSMQEVRAQENPRQNLDLAQLLAWQEILEVPLADLLVDDDAPLSMPVQQRARLLLVMKTAKSLNDSADDSSMRRLTGMLINQLVELMPELEDVSAWHSVGQRRTQEEIGRIAERALPDSFFSDRG